MSDIRDTYIRAVDLLARREHSERELATKLRQKGFDREQIPQVIEQLVAEGYLSNQRFAENYVQSRASRGFGPLKIQLELTERGVAEHITQAVFAELPEDFWRDSLESLWQKKFAGHVDDSVESKAKCVRYLQYKGYPSQDIFQMIDEKVRR